MYIDWDFRWEEWKGKKIQRKEEKFDRESEDESRVWESCERKGKRLGKREWMRDIFIAIFSEYLSEKGEFQVL